MQVSAIPGNTALTTVAAIIGEIASAGTGTATGTATAPIVSFCPCSRNRKVID